MQLLKTLIDVEINIYNYLIDCNCSCQIISMVFSKIILEEDIYVHTQEVTGSSPVVSTKKFLISQEIRNFSLLLNENHVLCAWFQKGFTYE